MVGRAVVGNHETRIPVRAEISRQDAESGSLFRVQAHLRRHVFEASVPQIAIQLRDGSFERLRTAVIFGTLRRITRTGIKLHVVNYGQIEQTVPIEVDKGGTGGPAGRRDSGARGRVCKGAVSVVVVKDVVVVVGYVEIGVAVVVVVAGRHAHAFIRMAEAGRFGDIGEREFAAWFA